jgi:hypothetical protein
VSITPFTVEFREFPPEPTTHVASQPQTPVPAGQIWVVEHISVRIETTTDWNARLDYITFVPDKAPQVTLFMPSPPPLITFERKSFQFSELVRMYVQAGQTLGMLVDGEQIVYVDAWVTGHLEPA